jgi:hypothetical protein
MFSFVVFTVLLGSSFQQCSIFSFHVQRHPFLLAGTFQLQLLSWNNSQHTVDSLCSLSMNHIVTLLPAVLLLLHQVAIGTDCVENTTSQLLCCCILRSCCLATDMIAELFPNNGCISAGFTIFVLSKYAMKYYCIYSSKVSAYWKYCGVSVESQNCEASRDSCC